MKAILLRICYLLAILLCSVVFVIVVLFSPIEFLLTGHIIWCHKILDMVENRADTIKKLLKGV